MNKSASDIIANSMNVKTLMCAGFLILFASSCYSYKTLSSEKEIKEYVSSYYSVEVLRVITTDNDTILFSDLQTGDINTNNIRGVPVFKVSFGSIDSPEITNGKLISFVYHGDTITRFEQNPTGLMAFAKDTVVIPFSEVNNIYVRKSEAEKVTAAVLISSAFIALIIYAATHFTISLGMGI